MTHLKLFLDWNATKKGERARSLASFCSLKAAAQPKVTRPSACEGQAAHVHQGATLLVHRSDLSRYRRGQNCWARQRMDLVVWCGVCVCVCAGGGVPGYLAEQHIAASLPVSRGLRRAIASDYL